MLLSQMHITSIKKGGREGIRSHAEMSLCSSNLLPIELL